MSTELTLKQWVESPAVAAEIAKVMPSQEKVTKFLRTVATQVLKTPKLKDCSRESLFACMQQCAAIDLYPDGRLAHLVPYKNSCTLILDYKGLVHLMRVNGDVKSVHCDVVRANDAFAFSYGANASLSHSFDLSKERGDIVGFYSHVVMPDGTESFEVLQKSEVDAIKERVLRSGVASPWLTDYAEMGKKTALRRHAKWLPLSPNTSSALSMESELEELNVTPASKKDARVIKPADIDLAPDDIVIDPDNGNTTLDALHNLCLDYAVEPSKVMSLMAKLKKAEPSDIKFAQLKPENASWLVDNFEAVIKGENK